MADLEGLFQHYIEQGLSQEEAAAQAEEKIDMSDEALIEETRVMIWSQHVKKHPFVSWRT